MAPDYRITAKLDSKKETVMVLPRQQLSEMILRARAPIIKPTYEHHSIEEGQIQPASIDLRLGEAAYRVWDAALPHGTTVVDTIAKNTKYEFTLSKQKKNILERDHTYLIPLMETCDLTQDMDMTFSPKSSTGRVDILVRVVCDRHSHYDYTPAGYRGPLYAEVTPFSYDVEVCAGLSLVQGRIKSGGTRPVSGNKIRHMHAREAIVFDKEGKPLDDGALHINDNHFYYHIDLDREIVGFEAVHPGKVTLDLEKTNLYDPRWFWKPIPRPRDGTFTLQANSFYLFATKERVRIPASWCGQILSREPTTGEHRSHYAGFFDNGFGGGQGTHGVLEIRTFNLNQCIVDGQPICAMYFEETEMIPDQLYQGNYTTSEPSLSKHFQDRYKAWQGSHWHL